MSCLEPEQIAAYLRGRGNGESRAVEAHARECPACALQLLLARETLRELGIRSERPVRRRAGSWIPWAAAAAVLVAVLTFALGRTSTPPAPQAPGTAIRLPTPVAPPPLPVVPETPRVIPDPPKPVEPPAPLPPAPPVPAPKPVPSPAEKLPLPAPPPAPPPPKPAPTVVERAVVARVTHAVGGPVPGRALLAGDSIATGRQEFLAITLEGHGSLWLRENSKLEVGGNGALRLNEGGLLARLDGIKPLAPLATPAGDFVLHTSMFDVQATRSQVELSLLDGQASAGKVSIRGPSALLARPGRAAEPRPLSPGFASWIPDKLASKAFSSWTEGESFAALQGFRALEAEGAFGKRAAVQTAEQGTAAFKSVLAFKGRHALWLRVRGYEAKTVVLGFGLNGQALGDVRVEAGERPWRWIGPLLFTADRCDLAVAALSRFPRPATGDRNSFPVVVDGAWVTSDLKAKPEALGDEPATYRLAIDPPVK